MRAYDKFRLQVRPSIVSGWRNNNSKTYSVSSFDNLPKGIQLEVYHSGLKRRVRGKLSYLADRHYLDLVQHISLAGETEMNAEAF